jgi:hypothetical protein
MYYAYRELHLAHSIYEGTDFDSHIKKKFSLCTMHIENL